MKNDGVKKCQKNSKGHFQQIVMKFLIVESYQRYHCWRKKIELVLRMRDWKFYMETVTKHRKFC